MASASDLQKHEGWCGVKTRLQARTRQDSRMGLPPAPSLTLISHAVYGLVTVPSGPAGGGRAIKEAPGSLRVA